VALLGLGACKESYSTRTFDLLGLLTEGFSPPVRACGVVHLGFSGTQRV